MWPLFRGELDLDGNGVITMDEVRADRLNSRRMIRSKSFCCLPPRKSRVLWASCVCEGMPSADPGRTYVSGQQFRAGFKRLALAEPACITGQPPPELTLRDWLQELERRVNVRIVEKVDFFGGLIQLFVAVLDT